MPRDPAYDILFEPVAVGPKAASRRAAPAIFRHRTGDCRAPRQLMDAIFDAHRLARKFDSPQPERPLPWMRERRIRDATAA